MPKKLQEKLKKIPDLDVLTEEPMLTAQIIKERLEDIDIKNVIIVNPTAMVNGAGNKYLNALVYFEVKLNWCWKLRFQFQ